MERRAYDIFASANREVSIKIIPGHFATKHSHVNYCIDMMAVKSEMNAAKAAAKLLAGNFTSCPVDTIITLDRMKMVGAFIAEELAASGINLRQNIAVITPEFTGDKMLLRDNMVRYIKGKNVLLLTASATTGTTVNSVVDGINYYGGAPAGVATVFGDDFDCPVTVVKIFGVGDIPEYDSFAPTDCPLCKRGVKVDALINSYGYSKLV